VTRAGRFATWPQGKSGVSAATLAREMAALAQVTLAPPPFPEGAPPGNGQPVIVIPGFLAPDMSTARLREFLERQGFRPYSWTGGFNIGPMPQVMRALERQIGEVTDTTGRAVTLIGVSLGGTTAREIAKLCPASIARVITLASPIHLPVVTPLAPLAEAASLLWDMEALEALSAIAEPPPVPLTALFSRDDGIIDWQASVPEPSEMVEVVEISGPHMTVCSNPDTQRIVAERLARA
jgi:pimeloyl-ACP methyl ester carboxylesterase